MRSLFLSAALAIVSFSIVSQAREPAYCNKKIFLSKRMDYQNEGLRRLNAFKLGRVTLAGVGIGGSESTSVAELAEKMGQVPESDKYCSWYLNEGNAEAEKIFTHIYMKNPSSLTPAQAAKEYTEKLAESFANRPVSLMYCMEKYGYAAVGCNGQKHRGPTVFGMILAYSGCSPESSADIVNTVWGLNGVPAETRLAVIKAAANFGKQDLSNSVKMRTLFEQ